MKKQTLAVLSISLLLFLSVRSAEGSDPQAPPRFSDISEMAQLHFSKGVYRFPNGRYEITSSITFADPVVFEKGAVFDLADGVTITFDSTFESAIDHVFTGDGTVAGLRRLHPEWFGAVGDGVVDDTIAIQKTIDTTLPDTGFGTVATGVGTTIVLTRSYLVSSLTVASTYVTIHSETAWLIAKKKGNYPHLLKFTHHFNRITGTLYIEGNYNLGYDCIINVDARHFLSNNVTIWRASLPWLIGNSSWATSGIPGDAERGQSENVINGGATVHCLRGVEAVGMNTIVSFANVLLYSYPWTLPKEDPRKAAWESGDTTLVRSIGSAIFFTGGALANFTNKIPLLEVQPIRCTKPNYFSNYGRKPGGGESFCRSKSKQDTYSGPSGKQSRTKSGQPGAVQLWWIHVRRQDAYQHGSYVHGFYYNQQLQLSWHQPQVALCKDRQPTGKNFH